MKNFTRQKKKIKLQTQNSETNLMELFIEQIDNEILRDKKKKKAEGYSVERRGDRRAAESQCYRHITNKREGHIFTKSSQTLPLIHYWHSQKFSYKNLTRTLCVVRFTFIKKCGIIFTVINMEYKYQAYNAAKEIIEIAGLKSGQILIVGCSTSEISGEKIGTDSSPEIAREVFDGIYAAANEKGVFVAAQCCEHLNRAVICERAAVPNAEPVNVVPFPKAGGSFATAAYAAFKNPVALEEIKADAGLDIGFTLIGMHLKKVAVPVRLKNDFIGSAKVLAARVRPKFIGGERAHYNSELL